MHLKTSAHDDDVTPLAQDVTSDSSRQAMIGWAAVLLDAMGNDKRLAVLTHIAEREICVTELSEIVKLSQSALSQHLTKLRVAGLVKRRRSAQTIYYSCSSAAVLAILNLLTDFFADGAANPLAQIFSPAST